MQPSTGLSTTALAMHVSRKPSVPAVPVVFVLDDNGSVRQALDTVTDDAAWRGEAFSSAAAFLLYPAEAAPSCLVLVIARPGGLVLQQRLAAERPDLPIICIADEGDVPTTVRAMKAGAVDVLAKPVRAEPLREAIAYALRHSEASLQRRSELRQIEDRYASLSLRERQVMTLVVSGLLNKQVGGELGISEITVKAHRGRVMRKMDARSLAMLVKMAGELELAHRGAAH